MAPRRKRTRDEPRDAHRSAQSEENDASQPVLGGTRGADGVSGQPIKPDVVYDISDTTVVAESFNVPFDQKTIVCQTWHHLEGARRTGSEPKLIFTHGAGAGLDSDSIVQFLSGFAQESSPVVGFNGSINLKSRVRAFKTVISQQLDDSIDSSSSSLMPLGGLSMGARAAVMTAQDQEGQRRSKELVLLSYPLVGASKGEIRDQILYNLSDDVDVLFVSGTNDGMCPISRLQDVRQRMKARSWLIRVEGADHGMKLKPKAAVEPVRRKCGAIAARWVREHDPERTECILSWDDERKMAIVNDWEKSELSKSAAGGSIRRPEETQKSRKRPSPKSLEDTNEPPMSKRKTRAGG